MRVCLLLVVLALAGCSTPNSSTSASASTTAVLELAQTSNNLNAVALDLVTAMASLQRFPPLSTTIQYSEPAYRFGHEVVSALRTTGYGTQKVSDDQGPHYIEIERKQTESSTSSGSQMRYSIKVANVTISRLFGTKGNILVPTSSITIQGAKPQPISKRSDIYESSNPIDESLTAFVFTDDAGNFLTRMNPGIIQNRVNPDQTFYPVKQLLIRFTPNTLDMGRDNKSAIKSLTDGYAQNDRFTISACHQINTQIWDGSNDIAFQRGKRVTQELLALGVPTNKTYNEDCSSNNYNNLLEEFTVILTLETTRTDTPGRSRQGRARYGFF